LRLNSIDPTKFEVVIYPDPALRRAAKPLDRFDGELAAVAHRMLHLMRQHKGVGLAAPQVGQSIRLFVCNVTGQPGDDLVCINPELLDLAGDAVAEEGCLSLPEVTVTKHRAESCRLRAMDLSGAWFERSGSGLAARCWQHELDHLNGRLIIDNMSEADRIANRRALKELESSRKKAAAR
jgi:peptide deformylase